MPVALASLIEGNWRTLFVLLFVRGFNPYNVYALVYGTLTCGEISIIPYLVNRIRAYVRLLILILVFYYALIIYPVFYKCAVYDFF